MALRRLAFFAMVLAASCGGTLPLPRIANVSPSQVRANVATGIKIRLEGVLPTRVDYGAGTASSESEVTVFVDERQIAKARVDSAGNVNATLPANLPPKVYDLIITLADGRQALSGGALTVNP